MHNIVSNVSFYSAFCHRNIGLGHLVAFKICKTANETVLSREKDQLLPEGLQKLAEPDSQTNRGAPEAWPCVTCHAPQAPPKLFEAKGKD